MAGCVTAQRSSWTICASGVSDRFVNTEIGFCVRSALLRFASTSPTLDRMPDNIFALPAKDWEVAQMTHSLARRACIGRCPEKRHDYRNVFDLPQGIAAGSHNHEADRAW